MAIVTPLAEQISAVRRQYEGYSKYLDQQLASNRIHPTMVAIEKRRLLDAVQTLEAVAHGQLKTKEHTA